MSGRSLFLCHQPSIPTHALSAEAAEPLNTRVCQNTKGRDVRPVRPEIYIDIYLTINCLSKDARTVQCGSNNLLLRRRSAYALQESSRGWSDSVTPGMRIEIICGIGASDSVAFYTTVGIAERSGRPTLQNPGYRQPFSVGYGRCFATPSPTATFLNRYAIL